MTLSDCKMLEKLIDQTASSAYLEDKKCYFDRFVELGKPKRKDEHYRYMKLDRFFARDFEKAGKKEHTVSADIVFINGHFCSEVSNVAKEIVVKPIKQAYGSYRSLFTPDVAKSKNPFKMLNGAFSDEGLFIYIPANFKQEKPISIVSLLDLESGQWAHPRIEVFVGKHAEVSFVYKTDVKCDLEAVTNSAFSFTLQDGAKVSFEEIGKQTEKIDHFQALTVKLNRASCFSSCFVDTRSHVRRDIEAKLLGEGAECYLSGLWTLDKEKELHTNVCVEHIAANAISMQHFKGILTDSATSTFQGKIFVAKEAQQTDSYQMNNNLILSDSAVANSEPNLEIYADDVKASHGSTVGRLEEEPLFYMKTRGLSEKEAKNFLITSFAAEITGKLSLESLQEEALILLKEML